MLVREIIRRLEDAIPQEDACSWDNVGLLLGDEAWDVNKVYVALDATDEVVEHAISSGADLIVTHHPMIFSGMKRIVASDFIGNKILRLAEHHIAVYAMHTNFDIHGMGDLVDRCLGLEATEVLDVCLEDGKGIGSVGDLPEEMTLRDYAMLVRDKLQIQSVKVFGEPAMLLKRVAILPGSGKSEMDLAISKGADVLVTGDVDHHSGIDANQKGLMVIDAGHYGVEHLFISYMANEMRGYFPSIEVIEEPKKEPFYVV